MADLKTLAGTLQVKNEDLGEVTAIVTTLAVVDRDGDVILPGAIRRPNKVKLSGYGHDVVLDRAAPVGMGEIVEEGGRAVFKGRFFMATTRGREAFLTVKELGNDGEWSFGFPSGTVRTAEMSTEWRMKGALRVIAELNPIEASPVLQGAGIGTGTLTAKSAVDSEAAAEFEKFLRISEPPQADYDAKQIDAIDRQLKSTMAAFHAAHGPTVETKADPDQEALARHFAAWAADKWKVVAPEVKWFSREPGAALGWQLGRDPGCIWVRTDIEGKELARVVLHETSHHARHELGLPNNEEVVDSDTDALLKTYQLEMTPRCPQSTREAVAAWSGRRIF